MVLDDTVPVDIEFVGEAIVLTSHLGEPKTHRIVPSGQWQGWSYDALRELGEGRHHVEFLAVEEIDLDDEDERILDKVWEDIRRESELERMADSIDGPADTDNPS